MTPEKPFPKVTPVQPAVCGEAQVKSSPMTLERMEEIEERVSSKLRERIEEAKARQNAKG